MINLLKNIFIPNKGNNFIAWFFHEKALLLYVLTAIVLKLCFVYFEVYFPQSDLFANLANNDVISLINKERAKNGLPVLVLADKLNQVAGYKADDMLQNQYFAHTSPDGITPWSWFKKANYDFSIAGENLAIHFSDSQNLISAWMQSPSHRDNILNPDFSEVGLAVRSGQLNGGDTNICVLELGAPQSTPFEPLSGNIISQSPTEAEQPRYLISDDSASLEPELQETIVLKTIPEEKIPEKDTKNIQEKQQTEKLVLVEIKKDGQILQTPQNDRILLQPRVLGAFTSKTDELIKNLYIYFSTFILMALVLTVLVRINIQNLPSIILAILLLILNIGLLYV